MLQWQPSNVPCPEVWHWKKGTDLEISQTWVWMQALLFTFWVSLHRLLHWVSVSRSGKWRCTRPPEDVMKGFIILPNEAPGPGSGIWWVLSGGCYYCAWERQQNGNEDRPWKWVSDLTLGNTHLKVFPTEGKKEKKLISSIIHFVFNLTYTKEGTNEKADPTWEVAGCPGVALGCFIIAHGDQMKKPTGWDFRWEH